MTLLVAACDGALPGETGAERRASTTYDAAEVPDAGFDSLEGTASAADPSVFQGNANNPDKLVAKDGSLFWANISKTQVGSSFVEAKSNGETREVHEFDAGRVWMTVDNTHVYWTDADNGTVKRVARAGGTEELLAEGQDEPREVVVDDAYVYWANIGGRNIVKARKEGGEVHMVASSQNRPYSTLLVGDELCWANFGTNGQSDGDISCMPRSGGAVRVVVKNLKNPRSLILRGTFLYFMQLPRLISRVSLGDGAVSVLVELERVVGLVADEQYLYWTTSDNPEGKDASILRMPLSGGDPNTLARGLDVTRSLAVDSRYVYAATGDRVIRRWAK